MSFNDSRTFCSEATFCLSDKCVALPYTSIYMYIYIYIYIYITNIIPFFVDKGSLNKQSFGKK